MPRIRTKPPRLPKSCEMRVPCSRCTRAWTGVASIKTLPGKLFREGWSLDLEEPNAWICPECSNELVPGFDD